MSLILDRFREPTELPGGIVILPYGTSSFQPTTARSRFTDRVFSLSTLDWSFRLTENGFLSDVIRHLPLRRLSGIAQLQKLTWQRVGAGLPHLPGPHLFDHNRLVHSLWSAVFRATQNHLLGINGPEALVGVLIEAVHDIFTTAYGDIMQTIFPALFNEDLEIPSLFSNPRYRDGWMALRDRWHLPSETPERVRTALCGIGLDGELHEMCDTASYMANDVDALMRAYTRLGQSVPMCFGPVITSSADVTRALSVIENVAVENGHAYVTHHDALRAFLRLRISMWREIYNQPGNKILEHLLRRVMIPRMFRGKKINPAQMMLWDDDEFSREVTEEIDLPDLRHLDILDVRPQLVTSDAWSGGRHAENVAARNGALTILVSARGERPVSAKVKKYLVRDANGLVMHYDSAHPVDAEEITRLALEPPSAMVSLTMWPGLIERLPPRMVRAWQIARRGWDDEPIFRAP